MNPNRKCGLCAMLDGGYGHLKEGKAALIPYIKKQDEFLGNMLPKEAVVSLRNATENCPICMFASIRQSGFEIGQFDGFNYEAESKSSFEDAIKDIYSQ
jgi:hypothetical protein